MSTSTQETRSDDTQVYLDRAFAIWRKAEVVHESPSWQGQPEARAIAEAIATAHPEFESALVSALADENALIVAYSLQTLEMMHSDATRNLPAELLDRRSKITLLTGSFKNSMDLGGLARQIQKRAKEKTAGAAKPS